MSNDSLVHLAWIIPVAVTAIVLLFVGRIVWGLLRDWRRQRWILQHGEPADATVKQLWDTGTRINGYPLFEALLEVRRPGEAPYQVKSRKTLHMLNAWQISPGATVRVKVDPRDPSAVAIMDAAAGPGVATGVRPMQVFVNGEPATSLDQLTPEQRQKVQQAMSMLGDADGDGVPDVLEGMAGASGPGGATATAPASDPVKALEELKTMHDRGLISYREFETKKAEILSRM